ncbi:MAG: HdeD family acid-resistance protein [Proteobacteria bacterium]|nr:HdeD family acid-resistance protein [Pseudomonadota bacterium]
MRFGRPHAMLTFLQKNWWILALRGLAAVIFGVLALVEPITAIAALVLLWGAYAFVDGIFGVFAAFKGPHKDGFPWWMLVMGLVGIAAGVYTFLAPAITALALLYLIAIVCIVRGVMEISAAIRLRKEINNEWWLILAGAASLIFGVLLFLNPGAGALALIVWIGIMAIVVGVFELILAFRIRNHAPKTA